MVTQEELSPALQNESETTPKGETVQEEHRFFRRIIRFLIIAVILLGIVRVFIFEPYAIPTGSMEPTILEGDVMIVNKLPYNIRSLQYLPFTRIPIPSLELPGLGTLEHGDVVVFNLPVEVQRRLEEGATVHYIKRCVAVSGDTVRINNSKVLVNGTEVDYPERGYDSSFRIDHKKLYQPFQGTRNVIVPYRGFVVNMDSISITDWGPLIESEGVDVEYRNRIVFLNGTPSTKYEFRRNYFFALGDNFLNSHDSRYFGFVPYDNLIGQASFIYWSRIPNGDIRWNRIGTTIR